jgi:hypothetical protein
MENFENLERLLRSKDFHQLTTDELELVRAEIGSEEEYELLRKAEFGLEKSFVGRTKITVHPAILKKIKSSWRQENAVSWYHLLKINSLPNYATILLLVAIGYIGWMGGASFKPKTLYVENIRKQTDTVFIASKPDTIIRERIVYVKTPATAPALQTAKSVQFIPVETSKGVNMKEKEELEKLLVSGSR